MHLITGIMTLQIPAGSVHVNQHYFVTNTEATLRQVWTLHWGKYIENYIENLCSFMNILFITESRVLDCWIERITF